MPARVFPGWVIVGAAFLVLFFAYGSQYAFGVFFSALIAEFAWSRSSLSGAFSLYAFGYCLLGFGAGRLTDRWGPRAVVAVGGLCLGSAMAGMALVTRLWQPYVLYGVVAAFGMSAAYVPCTSTVVKWFVRRRGLAVGVAGSGASFGTFALPLVAQSLVSAVGWRMAYVVFGVAILVILNAIAPLLRRDPESAGLHPDGDASPQSPLSSPEGWTLAEALQTPAFHLIGLAFTAHWMTVFAAMVHLVPFSRDLGHSPLVGASVVSALGAGAAAGRLVMGSLSDRVGRRPAVAASAALQVVGFAALSATRTLPSVYAAASTVGFSYGGLSALFPAIVGDYFGRQRAGALVGFLFAAAGAIAAWGPVGAGAIYDAMGSYALAFLLAAALNLVALGSLLLARPPGAPPRAPMASAG